MNGETWNKADDLRAKREREAAERTVPRLEAAYPWPGIPLDPNFFGEEVVVQSVAEATVAS